VRRALRSTVLFFTATLIVSIGDVSQHGIDVLQVKHVKALARP
jgi:hypothetical protein